MMNPRDAIHKLELDVGNREAEISILNERIKELRYLEHENAKLRTEIAQYKANGGEYDLNRSEQYRMQMAGISTAALGYWKESDPLHPDYDTVALRDVATLYAKYDALYKAKDAPEACCGEFDTCAKSCAPRGEHLGRKYASGDRSAYEGAREDVLIWKRRALEAESKLRDAPPSPSIAERKELICDKCGIDRMKADCKLGHPVDCGISGVAQGSFPAERKEPSIDGNPPAIGQSIGHSIGHGEPVHDMGAEGQA